ncbi:Kae1-like domain-containing protein [Insolitispirillum peregrinum]|uniref:Kae1-like domain-containing protein n=1 Tax=Insolitispirillum peregrinum TaxID=80876 RepID=UPI0036092EC6
MMKYLSPRWAFAPLSESAAAPDPSAVVALRLPLGRSFPDVIAVGAFLKATVTVIRGDQAWISRDLGNLDSPAAITAFEQTVEAMLALTRAEPVCIAHDLHPDFHSTRFAARFAAERGIPALAIQHHLAHMGAVLGEHQRQEATACVGLALDGFGLGPENAAWGGELLAVTPSSGAWLRHGGLALLAQPGGDVAARQPWRMALAALHRLGRADEAVARFAGVTGSGGPKGVALLLRMMEQGFNSPSTSSCGRLFDAACGLLGVLPIATFEGEAPMALEKLAASYPDVCLPADPVWQVLADGSLCCDPLLDRLMALGCDASGAPLACSALPVERQAAGAALFHRGLAAALVDWVMAQAPAPGTLVPLGGGCFFNAVLRSAVVAGLQARGLTPLLPVALSPGDPAISFGQAWCAAAHWVAQRGKG